LSKNEKKKVKNSIWTNFQSFQTQFLIFSLIFFSGKKNLKKDTKYTLEEMQGKITNMKSKKVKASKVSFWPILL